MFVHDPVFGKGTKPELKPPRRRSPAASFDPGHRRGSCLGQADPVGEDHLVERQQPAGGAQERYRPVRSWTPAVSTAALNSWPRRRPGGRISLASGPRRTPADRRARPPLGRFTLGLSTIAIVAFSSPYPPARWPAGTAQGGDGGASRPRPQLRPSHIVLLGGRSWAGRATGSPWPAERTSSSTRYVNRALRPPRFADRPKGSTSPQRPRSGARVAHTWRSCACLSPAVHVGHLLMPHVNRQPAFQVHYLPDGRWCCTWTRRPECRFPRDPACDPFARTSRSGAARSTSVMAPSCSLSPGRAESRRWRSLARRHRARSPTKLAAIDWFLKRPT